MDFTDQGLDGNLSLLPLDLEREDFDYVGFLRDEEADYLAEESSASEPTTSALGGQLQPLPAGPLPLSSTAAALLPASAPTAAAAGGAQKPSHGDTSPGGTSSGTSPPKQRLERRGHTKSRRGCFNCKRRRIKCQENRPACGHCVKTGLKCEYPAVPLVVHQPQNQIPIFTLQDMRFFQHFLMKCYPHHPLGNDSIWTHEVPCLSQQYDYLMHAVLGLAASDLMTHDPSLVAAAMSHRLKAIKAVKKALAEAPRRRPLPKNCCDRSNNDDGTDGGGSSSFSNEGNALMATCYALTFQSVLLDDGMAEFMTFIRGIMIVAVQMYMRGARFLFTNLFEQDQSELLRPLLDRVPPIPRDWSDGAVTAVAALRPLCEGDEVALEYHRLLLDMAEQLRVSSFGAYKAMTQHYSWWMQLPHDKFRRVVDPQNALFVLLASHWIAVKMVMRSITEVEHQVSRAHQQQQRPREAGDMEAGMERWLTHLNAQVAPAYRAYNAWPAWVERQMAPDPAYFARTTAAMTGGDATAES